MTCIVGLIDSGKVWMGGDSAGVGGWDLTLRADSKVFKNDGFLMGFTTSFRMGQLLRFNLKPPQHDPAIDLFEYMVGSFIPSVRVCLSQGGFAKKDKEKEEGGLFLVGYRNALFVVGSDYQVGIPLDGYAACGSGENLALGSLYTSKTQEPRARILQALEAAERHCAGVRGPFVIDSV